ncbi:MAG: hypothetical protein IT461_03155 [Planctomycetes bacterium]|nr:hypothetical protein [Planctomycetota bacterium]
MQMSIGLRYGLIVVALAAGGLGGYTYYIDATPSLELGSPALTLFMAAGLSLFLAAVGFLMQKEPEVVVSRPSMMPREARNSSVPTSMPYEAPDRGAPMIGEASSNRPTQRLNTQHKKRQTRCSVPLPKPLPPPQE